MDEKGSVTDLKSLLGDMSNPSSMSALYIAFDTLFYVIMFGESCPGLTVNHFAQQ